MRWLALLLLSVLCFQSAALPLIVAEDCALAETRHADDDCSPLCVTCSCTPNSHAFKREVAVPVTIVLVLAETPRHRNRPTPDAPPQDILHVPLSLLA